MKLIFTTLLLLASTAAANDYGIPLAPGEVLLSVNGVPVTNAPVQVYVYRAPVMPVMRQIVTHPWQAVTAPLRCTIDRFGNRSCR